MRRLILACALLLWGGLAGAQDLIRYYPPSVSVSGVTASLPGPAAGLNIYNVGNSGSTDFEVAKLYWTGNVFVVSTTAGGSGGFRGIQVAPGSGSFIVPSILATADDTYALGVAASNRYMGAYFTRWIQGSKSKTLTDAAAAVSFVRVAVVTNASAGGTVIWNAISTDGTSPLTQVGMTYFAGVNTAGTVTCTVGAVGTPITAYSRVNTLACTITAVTATTNCDLQVTCTDNLAGDQTPVFNWRLDMPVPNTVTPQ
jgi:hypothetical protein